MTAPPKILPTVTQDRLYKAPTQVQFVDVLPKSGSGKVMWRALQEAEGEKAENQKASKA